jgi:hypothetical protein
MDARFLPAAALLALALPAAAQSTPAANYTDMWWNPGESGWGISIAQHAGTHQVFAVWYTYDPREPAGSGRSKPLWFVMPGGTWTSPTRLTGNVYVTNGVPFNQSGSKTINNAVGSFTFDFSSSSTGTFTYNVAAPTGLASNDPAFNLPGMSGTKSIQRQVF